MTQRPSIAVIATGSELLDVDDELQPGKIRNSNGPMIKALSEKVGLNVEAYKIQQDDLQSSISVVKDAMSKHDIVITTGGVSVEILTIYLKFTKCEMQRYYLIKLQ